MQYNKLFGIGLSRTGTKSLATALNHLEIKTRWYPHDRRTHRQLLHGDFQLDILERYDAITDTPAAAFYPQFDQLYPQSKFILTARDKQGWLRSCRKHWQRMNNGPSTPISPRWRKFGAYIDSVVYGCVRFNEERFSYAYDVHLRNIEHHFQDRPDDLLVIDFQNGDGWESLCSFLDMDIPDTPFPCVNSFSAPTLQ